MLDSLSIKNFALIKDETIEFKSGLNVLVGQTGSGKSLIFDAILFVTGFKSDKTFLRSGEKQLKVEAVFSGLSANAKEILREYDIDCDEVLISRVLNEDGKSTIRINGQTVVLNMLKNLSKYLLDSLVQHESMGLLNSKNHLSLLDKFGGEKISKAKSDFLIIFSSVKDLKRKIESLGGDNLQRQRQKDFMLYEINEIEKAELSLGEDEELKSRLDFMSNSEKIKEAALLAENLLSKGQFAALNQISAAESALSQLSNIPSVSEQFDRLKSVRLELDDIADGVKDILNSVSFDETEFNRIDSRLDLIKSLKKKYAPTIEGVLEYLDKTKIKYDELEDSEEKLSRLENELKKAEDECKILAKKLTEIRKQTAKELEEKVMKELDDLGMKKTIFMTEFSEKEMSSDGADDVKFIFSANVGQNAKNLSKTASGGEASRLMLAIKNIFVLIDETNVLLFDEVDSGISGEVGNMVANKLLSISKNAQVLCITHLPQVASLADNFYEVYKEVVDKNTYSHIKKLTENEALTEIARLISGDKLSEVALNHAKELRSRKK